MVAKRFAVALVLSWVVCLAPTSNLLAQIFEAPLPSSDKSGQQATGNPEGKQVSGEVKQTNWPGIPWPTITVPKITMPKLPPLWPTESKSDSPALLEPFAVGYSKVSSGTKKAWEGTKDLFTVFQDKENQNPAAQDPKVTKTSFWQRLTTKKQQPRAPQTVGEFMKQPRLDP